MLCYIPLVPLQEASALTTCPHVSNVHAGETRTQSSGQRHTLWHDATLPAWPADSGAWGQQTAGRGSLQGRSRLGTWSATRSVSGCHGNASFPMCTAGE